MKARRGLQIFVAVLSIILLVCLGLLAVVTYLNNYLTFLPGQLVEFGDTFKAGLKAISDKEILGWYDEAVPAVFFGGSGLMLLLAIILILTKNKNGKDGKNIAGCIFALLGVVLPVACSIVFAKDLYAESALLIAYCVSGGVLALFVLFIGLALGVKPKKVAATEAIVDEQPADQVEQAVEQQVEPTVHDEPHEVEKDEPVQEEIVQDEPERDEPVQEESEIVQPEREVEYKREQDVATEYVPYPDVTTRDIVQKSYGKQGDELNSTTLAKINKVRALYEAKVITELEYIKLINKYLGF